MSSHRSAKFKRVKPLPLPSSVQHLERLTLKVTAEKVEKTEKKAKPEIQYTLTVTHRGSNAVFTQEPRPFEHFHQFKERLLKKLQQGHVCTAHCAYLHSFVKNYFPKKLFFGNSCPCLMDKRRERLDLGLTKLQQFLLARDNHGCNILLNDVAAEVQAFVLEDIQRPDHPLRDAFLAEEDDDDASTVRSSISSVFSTASEEEDFSDLDDIVCRCVCSLCNSSLTEDAFVLPISSDMKSPTGEQPIGNRSTRSNSTSSSTSSTSSRSSARAQGKTFCSSIKYTTTLGCGHTFHDECIVPVLNKAMECPACGHDESERL
ncbi:hypothetical protein FI667_g7777, partial [Globisporangium splendens]